MMCLVRVKFYLYYKKINFLQVISHAIMIFTTIDLTNGEGLEGRTYCPVGKIFSQVQVVIRDENFNEKLMGEAGEVSKLTKNQGFQRCHRKNKGD